MEIAQSLALKKFHQWGNGFKVVREIRGPGVERDALRRIANRLHGPGQQGCGVPYPNGGTVIEAGDQLLFLANKDDLAAIRALIEAKSVAIQDV